MEENSCQPAQKKILSALAVHVLCMHTEPTLIDLINQIQRQGNGNMMREKHKMLTFYLQSCFFFCHTESKNVATTLICATGSHT